MKKGNRILAITLSALMAFTIIPVMNQVTALAATSSSSSSISVSSDQYRDWARYLDGYADYYQQAYEQQKRIVEDAGNNGAWTDSHIYELQNINQRKEEIRREVGDVAYNMGGYGDSLDDVAIKIDDLNRRSRAGSISDMAYINKLHDIAATLRNTAAILEGVDAAIEQQLGSIFAGDGLVGTYSDDDDSLKIIRNGSGSSGEEQSSGSIERRKIKEDMYKRYEEHLKYKNRLQLPKWLNFIGDNAFSGWTSLNSILFYDEYEYVDVKMVVSSLDDDISLVGIGKQAFAGCTGLKEIHIPASVTEVGEEAFAGCSAVETIVIDDGAEGFADHIFSGCENLTSLEIPGSVGKVGAGFITDCPNLQTIEIGEGVTEIAEDAFADNPGLTDVYLPASIETVDASFLDTNNDVTIHGYEGTAAEEVAKETGNDFDSAGTTTVAPENGSCGENLTWELSEDGTLTIAGEGPITECPWLVPYSKEIKSIVIEEGVTEICDRAFGGCKNLENVSLPNSLTAIGSQAFMYGNYVFGENGADGKLKSIIISASVTTIGDGAFGVYLALDDETGSELVQTVEDFTVYGTAGSAAETYATENGLKFMVLSGWHRQGKDWYFYDDNGTMVKSSWKKDSRGWCYLGKDGKMITNGWAKDRTGWCWMGSDGYWVSNKWIKSGGQWYYIKANHYMAASEWQQDSKGWCYVGGDGRMVTNGWARDSKGWCWMGANGYWVSNKWVQSGGQWYYIKANHYMAANEWAKDSGGWMWMGSDGKITRNKWIKTGGYWYYLKSNGYMAIGTQKIGGKTYKFDSAGRWI